VVAEELFPKFTRERLYEQVAGHIEELISTGKLNVGDRLPPERELAEKLGVARGVVREAVKVLEVRGLVAIEPGRGTFVVEDDTQSLSNHLARLFRMGRITHGDLIELRRVLEVEIAGLAAQHASAESIKEMKQAVEEMDENISSPERYIAADLNFHLALARATQNKMFPLLIEVIVDLLQESRRLIYHVPGAPERGQAWHRLIAESVEKRDALGANDAMAKHMQQVAEDAAVGEQAACEGAAE
jgi:GntR family transcriptional repressor for pyruvate dehydrogenase complex